MKKYEKPIIKQKLFKVDDVIFASSDTNFGFWSWDGENEL